MSYKGIQRQLFYLVIYSLIVLRLINIDEMKEFYKLDSSDVKSLMVSNIDGLKEFLKMIDNRLKENGTIFISFNYHKFNKFGWNVYDDWSYNFYIKEGCKYCGNINKKLRKEKLEEINKSRDYI